MSYNDVLFPCRTLFRTVSGAVHCLQPSSLLSLPSVVQLLFLIIKTTLLCFLLSQAAPSNQYTLCIVCECVCLYVCVCVYSSCQMESLFASNLLSLSLSLSLSLYSGVCLFCPLIIKPLYPLLPHSPLPIPFFLSPSLLPSPSFFTLNLLFPTTPPPLPPLFSFLSLIFPPLAATSQPNVSENCHLTLLACIISGLLFALNFALNLWLFLFFLTVKLIN